MQVKSSTIEFLSKHHIPSNMLASVVYFIFVLANGYTPNHFMIIAIFLSISYLRHRYLVSLLPVIKSFENRKIQSTFWKIISFNLIFGSLWGATIFYLWPDNAEQRLLTTIIALALWTGAVSANFVSKVALSAFLVPIAMGSFVAFVTDGSTVGMYLGGLTIFYFAALYKMASVSRVYLLQVESLLEKNKKLSDRLAEKNSELQISNETLKEQEKYIQNSERVSLVSDMAVGVAHEINNPLMIVSGGLEFLLTQTKDIPAIRSLGNHVVRMKESIERISKVTENLAKFASRSSDFEYEKVRVDALLSAVQTMTSERCLQSNIPINFAQVGNLPECAIDFAWVSQVLASLIYNSLEAIADSTSEVNLEGALKISVIAEKQGDKLCLRVLDNGPGIPEGQEAKIFNAFYTSKLSIKGIGMGLPMSLKIVMEMGGTLEYVKRADEFTEFKIMLSGAFDAELQGELAS